MTTKTWNQSSPDSLQDLCIFYCVNNLECLTNSLMNWRDADDDASSVFSLLIGNKLLEYHINTCIPNEESQALVDQLLQNSQLCNSLQLNRKGMLSLENILELANNTLKHLDLTIFTDSDDLRPGLEILIENNIANLVSVKLQNKSDDSDCVGLLKAMCNVKAENSQFDKLDGSVEDADVHVKSAPANQKFSIRELDSKPSLTDAPVQNENVLKNLKSFSYVKSYLSTGGQRSMLDELLLNVLAHNLGLQSVSLVSAVSHPCLSYLREGTLYDLHNLSLLVMSSDAAQPSNIPEQMFVNLPKLKHLQHLDLSYGVELTSLSPKQGMLKFSDGDVQSFKQAVIQMPQLRSLDLSGTNLTEIVCHTEANTECTSHCMPGFEDRRFHYLGLYFSDTCTHEHIPANKISGTNSEEQLLVALWSHQHNKTIMYFVLKEIQIHINAMQSNLQKPTALFEGMIAYLEHTADWELMCPGSSNIELKNIENVFVNLYYLLRFKALQKELTLLWKRKLLDCVIVICNNCARDIPRVFGNSRDTLMQVARVALLLVLILVLEEVTIYSYSFEKYMRVLIRLMQCRLGPQRMMLVLRLIHSACRLGQDLKVVAGHKLKLVEILLSEITDILTLQHGNMDVLGKMWSILWTLTDEVPINCELFVKNGGCEVALTSCKASDEDEDLKRKVSGAMCNVSEVAHLRPRLLTKPLVTLFRELLDLFNPDNYDITSHAAAYLVLLAADGPEAWTLEEPTREEIVQDIDRVIRDHWDINKPKGVKFRSLTPMMHQLENFSTPTAQYWGAWMICNLIIVKPDRYCPMVDKENGLEIMERVLQQSGLREDVRNLLIQTRDKTLELKESGLTAQIAD